MSVKILAFAGSLRDGSYNKKLIRIASEGAKIQGIELELIDLADYRMPPYDGDLEEKEGLPEKAKILKKKMIESDGFLISSPEYNSSIAGTFKNVIDWVSRPEESDPYYLVAFVGKTAGIMSASPGALGGLRGLVHVRQILTNLSMHVLHTQMTLSKADQAFDESGQLKDPKQQKKALDLGKAFAEFTQHLKSSR